MEKVNGSIWEGNNNYNRSGFINPKTDPQQGKREGEGFIILGLRVLWNLVSGGPSGPARPSLLA